MKDKVVTCEGVRGFSVMSESATSGSGLGGSKPVCPVSCCPRTWRGSRPHTRQTHEVCLGCSPGHGHTDHEAGLGRR